MCLSPLLIKNPLLGHGQDNKYMSAKDCHSQYIYVPCNHCSECAAKRQADLIQRLKFEEKDYYLYFVTLTYDNKHLPYLSFDGVDGTEAVFPYANFKHVQDLLKRVRKHDLFEGRPFRYIAVSEYGKRRGRPHYHMILLVRKRPEDVWTTPLYFEKKAYDYFKVNWAINIGTRKEPVYEPLYTYQERYEGGQLKTNFDLHYVNPGKENGTSDVGYYVTKYIMKDSKWTDHIKLKLKSFIPGDDAPSRRMFQDYWRIIKPKCCKSIYFGLNPVFTPFGYLYDESIIKEIERGIAESVSQGLDRACVYDPVTYKFVPTSRYYTKRFMRFEEALFFASTRIDPFTQSLIVGENLKVSDYSMQNLAVRFARTKKVDEKIAEKYSSGAFIMETTDELPEIYYDEGM